MKHTCSYSQLRKDKQQLKEHEAKWNQEDVDGIGKAMRM
jgi:hypothetical protein